LNPYLRLFDAQSSTGSNLNPLPALHPTPPPRARPSSSTSEPSSRGPLPTRSSS
jgi:hypothetical protein